METPGGGGWGDPHGRDPDKVLHDVRLGFVSTSQAEALYGVVIGADGEIDMKQPTSCAREWPRERSGNNKTTK